MRSRREQSLLILLCVYLGIWAVSVLFFWLLTGPCHRPERTGTHTGRRGSPLSICRERMWERMEGRSRHRDRDDRCHERGAAQNRGLLRSRRAAGI